MICWMFDKITEKEQNKQNWKHTHIHTPNPLHNSLCITIANVEGAFNFIYAMPFWFYSINYFAFVLLCACVSLVVVFVCSLLRLTYSQPLKTCQRKISPTKSKSIPTREFKNTSLLSLTLFRCRCCCFQLLCAMSIYFGAWVFVCVCVKCWAIAILLLADCCCVFFSFAEFTLFSIVRCLAYGISLPSWWSCRRLFQ